MIAKRLIAALCAVGLILGAWVVRDRVIEGDGGSAAADDGSGDGNVVVCASELRDVCRAVADDLGDDITMQIANAGDTLDDLSTTDGAAPMWVTFAPFPQMVDEVRRARGLEPITHTESPLASSPLAAVVRPDSTDALVQACGDPVDLACLADQTQLSPTFAPLDTAIGTLGVAAAVAAHSRGVIDLSDVQFLVWARRLEAAGAHSLSGGTAIQTIQTRPTFPVAIGAEAELASAQRDAFDVLYADPMTSVGVELMVPEGVDAPEELAPRLGAALQANGWQPPGTTDDHLPDPGQIVAIRDFWSDLR